MNRLLSTALMLFCLPLLAWAQPAPNFTIYTTHDDTIQLYEDLLDQDVVVVIEVMFSTCPPCNSIATQVQDLYEFWGEGNDGVEFISLSNQSWDTNDNILDYENQHGLTFPGAGQDGGGFDAVQPYVNGTYGPFFGTPTFVVIAPDGSVEYDLDGSGQQATLDSVSAAIQRAMGDDPPVSSYHFTGNVSSAPGYGGAGIQDVQFLMDLPSGTDSLLTVTTDATGNYDITIEGEIPAGTRIRPMLDGEAYPGLTAYDLYLLVRHISALQQLDDLGQLQADVNGDLAINVLDGIELRKLLLGIFDEFTGGPVIFFASTAAVQEPGGDMTDHAPYIPIIEGVSDYNIDFYGLKRADLNHSYDGF